MFRDIAFSVGKQLAGCPIASDARNLFAKTATIETLMLPDVTRYLSTNNLSGVLKTKERREHAIL
jgi:hypothetical protein